MIGSTDETCASELYHELKMVRPLEATCAELVEGSRKDSLLQEGQLHSALVIQ